MFNNFLFIFLNGAFYGIMCRNNVAPDRICANVIRRMRFASWVTNATDIHPEYVTLLFHGNNGYTNAPESYLYTYTSPRL